MRTKFDSETFDMLNFVLLYIVPLLIMTVRANKSTCLSLRLDLSMKDYKFMRPYLTIFIMMNKKKKHFLNIIQ